MNLFLNSKLQELVLLSFTRTALSGQGGKVLSLPGLSVEDFMAASWDDLGCGMELRVQLGLTLARMFAPAGVTPGEVEDEAGLREVFARATGPAGVSGLVGERWRNAVGRSGFRQVVFMSSGSTGKPKAAVHSQYMLLQELEALTPLFKPLRRVVALTPLQHSYGFMCSVLITESLGLELLPLPPFPPLVREVLAPGDMMVAFPDFWRNMPLAGYIPPKDVICLSATAPWPEEEQKALAAAGYSHNLEVYGSSENGVVGWRTSPDNPFELLSYFSRDPGSPDFMLRSLPDGEQRVPLQDNFLWEDERHFRPVGRSDHAVQVSGINVYPSRIARLISGLPGVSVCKVRPMRPEEGHRLKAFVIPAEGWSESRLSGELKAFFQANLKAPERPVSITFGTSLPKTMYGKDSDW